MLEAEFLPTSIKLIPVCFSFFGAGLALILNIYFQELVAMFTTFKLYIFVYKNKISGANMIKIMPTNVLNFDRVIGFKENENNIIVNEFLIINIPNVYKFLNKK